MIINSSSSGCIFKSEAEGSLTSGRRNLEAGGIHAYIGVLGGIVDILDAVKRRDVAVVWTGGRIVVWSFRVL